MKRYKKAVTTTTTTVEHDNPSYINEEIVYEDIEEILTNQPLPDYVELEDGGPVTANQEPDTRSREDTERTDTYLTVIRPHCCTCLLPTKADPRLKIALLVCCAVILGLLSCSGYLLFVITTDFQHSTRGIQSENESNFSLLKIANESRPNISCLDVEQSRNATRNKTGSQRNYLHFSNTRIVAECASGWVKYRDSCYLFSGDKGNFVQAAKFCYDQKASVVLIETEEENRFLRRRIQKDPWKRDYWIGLVDLANNEKWIWIGTYKQVVFEDWSSGEPNFEEKENCAILLYNSGSRWNNVECDVYYVHYLCEQP